MAHQINARSASRPWRLALLLLALALVTVQCSNSEPEVGVGGDNDQGRAGTLPDVDDPPPGQLDPPPEPGSALLRQDGMRLLNGDGDSVILRGVNLGGWLLWEGWIWGGWGTPTKVNSETYIFDKLANDVGIESAEEFRQAIYENYITEADIARVAELGYNMVRVPINHRLIENDARPGTLDPEGVKYLDRLVEWGSAHEVYVVLDMHAAPGGQSEWDAFTGDPEAVNLWESPEKQDRTVSLWRALAHRYASEEWVAGYDLLNEPLARDISKITSLYNRIITAIREVDPYHTIFVEGAWGAHELSVLGTSVIDDANLVYSFHAYEFIPGRDLVDDFAEHVAYARSHDRPLYVGEYGHDTGEVVAEWTERYKETPEVVGWSHWTWKRASTPNEPVVQEIQVPGSWKLVIAAITIGGPIGLFDVQQAMDDFVGAISLADCVEDSEFVSLTL